MMISVNTVSVKKKKMKKNIHFIMYTFVFLFSSCLPEGGESSIYLPVNGDNPPVEESSVMPISFDFGDYNNITDTDEDIVVFDTIVTISRLVRVTISDIHVLGERRNSHEPFSFYVNGENNLPEQKFYNRNLTNTNYSERITLKNAGYNYFVLIAEAGVTDPPVTISFKLNEVTLKFTSLNIGQPVGIVVQTL